MNNIVFKDVCKYYGKVEVIRNLNLEIPDGQRLILLGPSGCGKTTILRMISGLEKITSGDLYMGGQRANDVEPGDRNVAMVFQNYALYPHMTVANNILFGMQVAKVAKSEQNERLNWALNILGLTHLKDRFPRELSGGQRQRVALCRALVKKSPYFLLDEPLSNLDAQLRTLARGELVKVHEVYHPTFVYVTHDQIEAMTIGQKIVLIDKSIIQQFDTPSNIYNRPANVFVAKFIGSPSMNIVDADVDGNELVIEGQRIAIPDDWRRRIGERSKLKLGIRPENIRIQNGKGDCRMNIDYVENHGSLLCIAFKLNGVTCMATADVSAQITSETYFMIDWDKVHLFDCESTENIGYPEERIKEQTNPYLVKQ
jgi:ABC-type sugar transport system ATPase subunit